MKVYVISSKSAPDFIYTNKETALKDVEAHPGSVLKEVHCWSYEGIQSYSGSFGKIDMEGTDFIETLEKEVPKIIMHTFGARIGYKLHEAMLERESDDTVLLKVKYQPIKKLDELDDVKEKSLLIKGVDKSEFGERYVFEIIKGRSSVR